MPKHIEIRIQFAELLYSWLSPSLMEYYDIKSPLSRGVRDMPSAEWVQSKVDEYNAEWMLRGEDILVALQELLKLSFYRQVIDVYVAPYLHEQSTPILVGTKYTPDQFVDVLIHELIHVLLSDNAENIQVGSYLNKMFPEEEPKVRIHVIVHACLQHIYLNVLGDEARLSRDIAKCAINEPYMVAWKIVETHGYEKVIRDFITHYS